LSRTSRRWSQGETAAEAMDNIRSAIKEYLEAAADLKPPATPA
jgi:predicted RNase H-like HicB family nuclease